MNVSNLGLTWYGWYTVIMAILSVIAFIHMIDRPRPPITTGLAIFMFIYTFISITLILTVGVNH